MIFKLGKVPGRSGRGLAGNGKLDWRRALLQQRIKMRDNTSSELQWVIAMRSMFVLSQLCSHLRVRNRGGNTMGLTLTVSFDTPFIFEE